MTCIAEACMLLAWGYNAELKGLGKPDLMFVQRPIQVAYAPPERCTPVLGNTIEESGCSGIEKPHAYFPSKCASGSMDCHREFDRLEPMPMPVPQTHVLPTVRVVQPRPTGKVRPSKRGDNGQVAGRAEKPKSVGEQIAEQLAQQAALYAAQSGGAYAGAALGSIIPGVGTVVGAIIGSWTGCTETKLAFIRQEWALKERWDLHPEKEWGNRVWATKMCSPLGFFFRFLEEKEPFRKLAALSGGLAAPFIGDYVGMWPNLVGQLGPVAPAAVDNLKLTTKAFSSFAGSSRDGHYSWQSKPYHNGPWEATTQ